MSENTPPDVAPATDIALVRRIMKRQASLSLSVAIVFVLILLGLPLLNLYAPTLMNTQVGGFTLSWLILGVLFYPITWLLSAYFVKQSNKIEEQITIDEGGKK